MPTALFVHGISVRDASLSNYLRHCRHGLEKSLPGYNLRFLYWGDHLGAPYHPELKSIPLFHERGGKHIAHDEENNTAMWALLYSDPWFELRLLGSQSTPAEGGLGQTSPAEELRIALQDLTIDGVLSQLLSDAGLEASFPDALGSAKQSDEVQDSITSASSPLAPFRKAIARGLLAESVIAAMRDDRCPKFCFDPTIRDSLIDEIVNRLGGVEGAMPPWLLKSFLRPAMSMVTRNFGALAQSNYRLVGDLLKYQCHGHEIRQAIRHEILALEPPVLLLGHSLGGIASFETITSDLTEHDGAMASKVKLLATIGSQIGFFYECDALASLRLSNPESPTHLPNGFPNWLNIYDPSDLLSFLAEPLFQGVKDKMVASGQPFPVSHSTYFGLPEVWNEIAQRME